MNRKKTLLMSALISLISHASFALDESQDQNKALLVCDDWENEEMGEALTASFGIMYAQLLREFCANENADKFVHQENSSSSKPKKKTKKSFRRKVINYIHQAWN